MLETLEASVRMVVTPSGVQPYPNANATPVSKRCALRPFAGVGSIEFHGNLIYHTSSAEEFCLSEISLRKPGIAIDPVSNH